MRELRLMKLVAPERRGRMVYYRLADAHIRHVLEDTLRHVREGRP
jgi:DNA-binding transcriptional ArsR family regulator